MKKLRTISVTAATVVSALLLSGALSIASARDREPRTSNRNEVRQVQERPQMHRESRPVVKHYAPQSRVVVKHQPTRTIHRSLPNGYRTLRVADRPYYYHNGVYYNHCNNGYEVVTAPRIRHLPHHARRVVVNQAVYFVSDDVYYSSCGDYYEVCEAPRFEASVVLNAGPLSIVLQDNDCHHHR